MTRKDYETIASAFWSTNPGNSLNGSSGIERRLCQWGSDIRAMADGLAADNARFNRALFYERCGYSPNASTSPAKG